MTQRFRVATACALAALSTVLAACGGGSTPVTSTPPPPAPPPVHPPPTTEVYKVSGIVTGLLGLGLMLNGYIYDDDFPITANGPFESPDYVPASVTEYRYEIRVTRQPSAPAQHCAVARGIGVARGNVNDVVVNCAAYAFVVDAGDATIAAYAADAATGRLSRSGQLIDAGVAPQVMVATPDKQFVYSAGSTDHGISAFQVDAASGALTGVNGYPFTTPDSVCALAIAPDSKLLYATLCSANKLVMYDIGRDGALTAHASAPHPTGAGPAAVVTDSDNQFAYVANHGGSHDISVYALDVDQTVIDAVAGSPFASGVNVQKLGLSALGNFLYGSYSDPGGTGIVAFSVNTSLGTLTSIPGVVLNGTVINDLAIDRGGAFLYVSTPLGVYGYGIDPGTGALTALAGFPMSIGGPAGGLSIDPTNRFMYVTDVNGGQILEFSLDASNGSVVPSGESPVPTSLQPTVVTTL